MMKMKKRLIALLIIILSLSLIINVNVKAKASFTEISIETRDLGYGVTIDKVIGTSKSDFWESYWGGSTNADGRGQMIYTANINPSSPAYVVQWTMFPSNTGEGNENTWGVSNLSNIAKDYEAKHPGKKVLVATNNWLSDCSSSNTGELDGVQIADGLNYRVSDKQGNGAFSHDYIPRPFILGFDKNGKVIFDDDYNSSDYTDKLILSFYNEVDSNGDYKEKTYLDLSIDKINQEPSDNELAIYFRNYGETPLTINNANIYKFFGIVRHDEKEGSDFVERDAFGKGKFISKVDNIDFSNEEDGTFFIVSKNAKFDSLDLTKNDLVCQYELTGDLKDIIGATTYYYHIVRDGVAYNNTYYGNNEAVEWSKGSQINFEIHPRTALIIKEDGSIALSVIDGRRASEGMTGMDYQDMANFYKTYYNAKEAFNYDGGGSSAMVVANSSGSFDCINNPSDGHMRGVANACLIVVDEEPFEVKSNADETNKLVLNIENIKENVEKIYAKLGENTYEAVDNNGKKEIVIDGLDKETMYTVEMSWKNKNSDVIYSGAFLQFETASQYAYVEKYEYELSDDGTLLVKIKVKDEVSAFTKGTITVDEETLSFRELENEIEFLDIDPTIDHKVVIRINSKVVVKTYIKTVEFNIDKKIEDNDNDDVNPEEPKSIIDWKKVLIYSGFGVGGMAFACVVYLINKQRSKKNEEQDSNNIDEE